MGNGYIRFASKRTIAESYKMILDSGCWILNHISCITFSFGLENRIINDIIVYDKVMNGE